MNYSALLDLPNEIIHNMIQYTSFDDVLSLCTVMEGHLENIIYKRWRDCCHRFQKVCIDFSLNDHYHCQSVLKKKWSCWNDLNVIKLILTTIEGARELSNSKLQWVNTLNLNLYVPPTLPLILYFSANVGVVKPTQLSATTVSYQII